MQRGCLMAGKLLNHLAQTHFEDSAQGEQAGEREIVPLLKRGETFCDQCECERY